MAKTKKVTYRVIRNERVGIGPYDAVLTIGQVMPDDTSDDVIDALLRGQIIEEVPEDDSVEEPDIYSQEYRDDPTNDPNATYESWSPKELAAELKSRGLATSGTPDEQMSRLEADDAAKASDG